MNESEEVTELIRRLFAYSHEVPTDAPDYEQRSRDLIDAAGLISDWQRLTNEAKK